MSSTSSSAASSPQVVEAVARADERERDVVAAQLVLQVGGGPHGVVDAVLRAHHADVDDEVLAPAAVARARSPRRFSASGSGPVRTTVTSSARLPPAADGDLRGTTRWSRSRGRRCGRCGARAPAGRGATSARSVREARLVELRAQVVLVEDELHAERLEEQRRAARRCRAGCRPGWRRSRARRAHLERRASSVARKPCRNSTTNASFAPVAGRAGRYL